MNTNRLYVDFHIIQTVPPSCINRDDTGRPKTAFYGGANRARVSSQAWKHAMRGMFTEIFSEEQLGFRTKYAASLIKKILVNHNFTPEKAEKKAADALTNAGVKTNEKKGHTTGALFFISAKQAEALAELIIAEEKDKAKYKAALKDLPSVDIALFGRMVADDNSLNVDAAAQVAHSISTHAIQNEYDYFTAVDDCNEADNAGAGHLGTMEFNSATLYRYATVNAAELLETIGDDAAKAVRGFAEAMICAMPTGKQNSYANRTLPDLVYVTLRCDQPVNLSGAFEKPVCGAEGYAEKSVKALFVHAEKVYADYCGAPAASFVIGHEEILGAKKTNLNALLDALEQAVQNGVI